jgi:hypothetical protein
MCVTSPANHNERALLPLRSGLVRRLIGLVPVLLLALAVVTSAVIGLNLSHGKSPSPRDVAAELGCEHIRNSRAQQAGVSKTTCSNHGGTIVIVSLSKGPHTLYPPDTYIIGPAHKAWVIECSRHDDCVKVQREFGGWLNSGPTLGLSLLID